MLLAILGDVHGDFESLTRALALEPAAAAWLCVGDLAADSGDYPSPSRPFFFIKGNNEDFDVIARLEAGEPVQPNLRLIPNGRRVDITSAEFQVPSAEFPVPSAEFPVPSAGHSVVRVVGLGGTFAPTWYDTPPGHLPAGRRDSSRRSGAAAKADDKRRHFVRAEVDACLALAGVDIVLTHEAPRPYWVGGGRRRNDAGKAVINEILAAVRPRLHVFGHHHRFSERVCEGVPSVGLPLAGEGYLRVETEPWAWRFLAAS